MKIKFHQILILLTAYFSVLTSLCAQDFALELMKTRASLDMVIVEAGPKYHKIKPQADAIGNAIEDLRLKTEDSENLKSSNFQSLIVKFRRKIVCVHISIKALKSEIDKYSCMGTTI